MITPLNLPVAPLQLSRMNGTVYVVCLVRKKKLVMTPEEWVRQHVIHFLHEQNVPKGLIGVEVALNYNGRSKRADIVIYEKDQRPLMIIECKAPEVPVDEAVFRQIASYNHALQVRFLMLTNGLHHVFAQVNLSSGEIHYLESFPNEIF